MAQHAQVHGRVAHGQLPPNKQRQPHDRGDRQGHDRRGLKPVVLLALFQEGLQAAHGDRQQANAPPIDRSTWAGAIDRAIGGQKQQGHRHRRDAEGDIDEKDPAPPEVIGQVAAEGRPDRRARNHPHPENRLGQTLLGGRKALE